MAQLTVKKTSGGTKWKIYLGRAPLSIELFDRREYAVKEAQRLANANDWELSADLI